MKQIMTAVRGALFQRDWSAAVLFLAPGLSVLFIFLLLPILYTIPLSAGDYDVFTRDYDFTGLDNFDRLVNDSRFWHILGTTLIITIGAVTLNNVFAMVISLALNQKMPASLSTLFRTAYFLPFMATAAAVAQVWQFLLTEDRGIVNFYLGEIGIGEVPWIAHPIWAKVSVIIFDVWKSTGFLTIIYLAGLQNIPDQLYEAAEIEGASRWRIFRKITIPMLSPTLLFAIIVSSVGAFQIFDNSFVLTGGGPGDSSRTMVMYIYSVAFERAEPAYAATVSLVVMLGLSLITALQFWASKKWVHYG